MQSLSAQARAAALVVAAVAVFALGWQIQISITNHRAKGQSAGEALWFLYGYFTIWTNSLVAVTALVAGLDRERRSLLARHSAQTAVAVYIFTVMLIYEGLLRGLIKLEGAQWRVDILLHDVVPILWIGWWILFSRKSQLGYGEALKWIIYPLSYLAYALIRGALTGIYAYPFINVSTHGYATVMVNSLGIAVGFLALASVFIFLDRRIARV